MSIVYIDHIQTLEAEERRGRIESLRRLARIAGLTSTDWSVLTEALADLGLAAGSSLSSSYPNLILIGRSAELVDGANNVVDVTLDYEYEHSRVQWSASVSLETATTTLDAPVNDPNDRSPQPVTVEYTFPADYEHDESFQLKTDKQRGEFEVDIPVSNQTAKFVIQEHNPGNLLQSWVGFVNSEKWAGGPARTWKCVDGRASEFDTSVSPFKYEIELEFSFNPNGWDPSAAYRDPYTGEIPPDADSFPDAIKTVKWPPSRRFQDLPT